MKKLCIFFQFYANYQRNQMTHTAIFLLKSSQKDTVVPFQINGFFAHWSWAYTTNIARAISTLCASFIRIANPALGFLIWWYVLITSIANSFQSKQTGHFMLTNPFWFAELLSQLDWNRRFWPDQEISFYIMYVFSDTISRRLKNAANGHLLDEALVE